MIYNIYHPASAGTAYNADHPKSFPSTSDVMASTSEKWPCERPSARRSVHVIIRRVLICIHRHEAVAPADLEYGINPGEVLRADDLARTSRRLLERDFGDVEGVPTIK